LQGLYIFQGSRERKKRGGKEKTSSELYHVCGGYMNPDHCEGIGKTHQTPP